MVRMSAEERRESVIRAAMTEFARGGYRGTSTEVIARRVGVSQPYLFRLFKSKEELFLVVARRCVAEARQRMTEAADGLEPHEAHDAMAEAYKQLLADPDTLLLQMQVYVAVASAEATGDHAFGAEVRAMWEELWDALHLALGADVGQTTEFLAFGMLINVLASLGYPQGHRVWEGFDIVPCPKPSAD
ncbi:TetR/AcrR family transcriptional regulator [Streptomyces boncukensis]|uniref:TetR/AcrR family transcriptional regulator n=1 Tax=Streptomyces boncukensis TaxID=2711219 RepID=A0A6G4WQ36_9ACTN|nr:TetR/AcrR family transcriptional regulator [Streptomyces boncukensis]NGO66942.1 TetR/AcrR family transcriptional regulator [Streptomyces boncukensis]